MGFGVWVDDVRVSRVSLLFSGRRLGGLGYDLEIFPSRGDSVERQFSFFTAMVAIDHRTGVLYPFEAWVGGRWYRGSDLLYRLGVEVYRRDPDFFMPRSLAELSVDRALRLLSCGGLVVWDLHVRTLLLRDLGSKILQGYDSYGGLLDVGTVGELLDRLSWFRAFEDPVAKKSFLLAKLLLQGSPEHP